MGGGITLHQGDSNALGRPEFFAGNGRVGIENGYIYKVEGSNITKVGTINEEGVIKLHNIDDVSRVVEKTSDDIAKEFVEDTGKSHLYPEKIGERKVDRETYKKLRRATPNSKMRKNVNKGIKLPMEDPALPGKIIDKPLQPDHIVSMDRITRMEGFDKLTFDQQVDVLNYEGNFEGLSEAANKSKGSKSYSEWVVYKPGTPEEIQVDSGFRKTMIEKEKAVLPEIEEYIKHLIGD